jgi:rare lipoprotein A
MQGSWLMQGWRLGRVALVGAALSALAACASGPRSGPAGPIVSANGARVPAYNRPYEIRGRWYTPMNQPNYDVVGVASWYSYESHNRTTSDGEVFDARLPTAAHTTLPIPSYLEVTNLDNGRKITVRLNDRGPFVAGRLIDLTRGAAEQLGYAGRGTARVRVRYLGPAPAYGRRGSGYAEAEPPPAAPVASASSPPPTDKVLADGVLAEDAAGTFAVSQSAAQPPQ